MLERLTLYRRAAANFFPLHVAERCHICWMDYLTKSLCWKTLHFPKRMGQTQPQSGLGMGCSATCGSKGFPAIASLAIFFFKTNINCWYIILMLQCEISCFGALMTKKSGVPPCIAPRPMFEAKHLVHIPHFLWCTSALTRLEIGIFACCAALSCIPTTWTSINSQNFRARLTSVWRILGCIPPFFRGCRNLKAPDQQVCHPSNSNSSRFLVSKESSVPLNLFSFPSVSRSSCPSSVLLSSFPSVLLSSFPSVCLSSSVCLSPSVCFSSSSCLFSLRPFWPDALSYLFALLPKLSANQLAAQESHGCSFRPKRRGHV